MAGALEQRHVRAGYQRQEMLGKRIGWFYLVVLTGEHQDSDVDVG